VARAGPQASPPQARSHPSSRRCDRRRSLAHRPGAHRLARALRQGQALSEPRTMNGRGFWARIRQRWTANDREFLVARFDALERHMQSLRAAGNEELATVREALAALEKQIGRSGREQFKANTLAETQAAQLAAALDALRAADM